MPTETRSHRSGLTEATTTSLQQHRSGSPHNNWSTQLHSPDWNAIMRKDKKVRRRLLALVATAATAFFLGAVPAYADNGPHVSTATNAATTGVHITDAGQGRCASCHRAHTARAAFLLNATSEESLCYSCHGDGGTGATTDVQSGLGYDAASTTKYPNGTTLTVNRGTTVVGALRGGGFDKAALGTGAATKDIVWNAARSSWSSASQLIPPLTTGPQDTTSSHLGGAGIMWGNGPISSTANAGKVMSTTTATKLECTACHDPHGNGQYRILRAVPTDSGFTATLPGNTTPGIVIKDTANKVYTTTNYWIAGDPNAVADTGTKTILGGTSSVDPTPIPKTITATVSSFQANVAAWCTTCHTRYLAPSNSYKTNSGDAIFTYRHTGDNVSGDAASNRNCIQCHVAHGSNAQMPNSKVEFPGGTTTSSDSRLLRVDDRGTCVMCHNV
jgi:predicted CXXCH cytochrome family protein